MIVNVAEDYVLGTKTWTHRFSGPTNSAGNPFYVSHLDGERISTLANGAGEGGPGFGGPVCRMLRRFVTCVRTLPARPFLAQMETTICGLKWTSGTTAGHSSILALPLLSRPFSTSGPIELCSGSCL